MKKLFKTLKLLLVITIVACTLSYRPAETTVKADDADFDNNYDYYCELCTTKPKLTEEEKQICASFKTYEENKRKELNQMIAEAEANLDEMKKNIMSQGVKISEYNAQKEVLEKQINVINTNIAKIESNIDSLNKQIEEREIKIENLNNQIKERMAASQGNVRTNSYVKFIMGASTFVDLLRRISAINEITDYDMGKIDEMEAEKVLLQKDIDDLQVQKDRLVEEQANLEIKKQGLNKLIQIAQELLAEFQRREAEFEAEMDALAASKKKLDENINKIYQALNQLEPSLGFGQFFKNATFYVSTGAFYYPSGGFHAAIDCAVNIGTALYPVANGVVMDTGTGCPYNGGYMGNTCNWGRGNYIFYLCQIEDRYYFVQYDHLKDVNVSIGQNIIQGYTYMGTTGNSGSSSGPHLHIAVYFMGTTATTTPQRIIEQFKIYDNRFGLANNITGSCQYRGWSAPCYMNPTTDIYGFKYGNWYTVSG